MTDQEIIHRAVDDYESEIILIQNPAGPDAPSEDEIVDRVEGGAWVMAWVWVADLDTEEAT